jgi:hypothetical protein
MAGQIVVDETKLRELIAREVDKALNSRFRNVDEIRQLSASAEVRNEMTAIRNEIATKAQIRRIISLLIVALILVIIMTVKYLFFYP